MIVSSRLYSFQAQKHLQRLSRYRRTTNRMVEINVGRRCLIVDKKCKEKKPKMQVLIGLPHTTWPKSSLRKTPYCDPRTGRPLYADVTNRENKNHANNRHYDHRTVHFDGPIDDNHVSRIQRPPTPGDTLQHYDHPADAHLNNDARQPYNQNLQVPRRVGDSQPVYQHQPQAPLYQQATYPTYNDDIRFKDPQYHHVSAEVPYRDYSRSRVPELRGSYYGEDGSHRHASRRRSSDSGESYNSYDSGYGSRSGSNDGRGSDPSYDTSHGSRFRSRDSRTPHPHNDAYLRSRDRNNHHWEHGRGGHSQDLNGFRDNRPSEYKYNHPTSRLPDETYRATWYAPPADRRRAPSLTPSDSQSLRGFRRHSDDGVRSSGRFEGVHIIHTEPRHSKHQWRRASDNYGHGDEVSRRRAEDSYASYYQ